MELDPAQPHLVADQQPDRGLDVGVVPRRPLRRPAATERAVSRSHAGAVRGHPTPPVPASVGLGVGERRGGHLVQDRKKLRHRTRKARSGRCPDEQSEPDQREDHRAASHPSLRADDRPDNREEDQQTRASHRYSRLPWDRSERGMEAALVVIATTAAFV